MPKRGSSGSKSERVSLPPQLWTGQHFPVHSTQNHYVRIWTKVGSSGSFRTKAPLPQPSVAKKAECKIQSGPEQLNGFIVAEWRWLDFYIHTFLF